MGRKSSYFRHSFLSHKDPKIRELIERGKGRAHSVYMILLELYGEAYANDDTSNITQKMALRQISNACGLRPDSCWTCIQLIADCKLIEAFRFELKIIYIEVRIPKFLKYFGKYSKTETIKCPNKRKENKIKEKEINIEHSVIKNKSVLKTEFSRVSQVMHDWNEVFGSNESPIRPIRYLTEEHKILINASMKENSCLREIGSWKFYFERIKSIDFLNGLGPSNWVADFEWCINKKNIQKVISGKYENNSNVSHAIRLLDSNPF